MVLRDVGSVYFDLNFTLEVLTLYETYIHIYKKKPENYTFLTIINTRLPHNNNNNNVQGPRDWRYSSAAVLYNNYISFSRADTATSRIKYVLISYISNIVIIYDGFNGGLLLLFIILFHTIPIMFGPNKHHHRLYVLILLLTIFNYIFSISQRH